MINQLTIRYKNQRDVTIEEAGWSEDAKPQQHWQSLFDWYRYSLDATFVLGDGQGCILLHKEHILDMLVQLLPDNIPPPTTQESKSWFRRIFMS